jgi:hypothetical protein
MRRVRFEPHDPLFEWKKSDYALDRAPTVTVT